MDKDSLTAAIRSAALGDVLRTMNSDDLSQKMLAKTRALPDEILDAEAKKAGVPEDQWPLHRAMIRGEPNAFMDELETVDGLLRPGVEKDRAEQQIIAGMLDHVREFLAFTLPTPADHNEANALMEARNEVFYGRLQTYFVSGSKAKVTAHMESVTNGKTDFSSTARVKGE